VPCVKQLVSGLSLWRAQVHTRVNPCEIFGGQCGSGTGFSLEFFIFPLLILISLPHEVCDTPEQAAHYHILGPKLGASSLYQHLAGTEETRRRD
jgi:hypothetical protein